MPPCSLRYILLVSDRARRSAFWTSGKDRRLVLESGLQVRRQLHGHPRHRHHPAPRFPSGGPAGKPRLPEPEIPGRSVRRALPLMDGLGAPCLGSHRPRPGKNRPRLLFQAPQGNAGRLQSPLAGKKLSYYDLRLMRLTEGDAAFNSEMQNQPIDPAACLFSAQWFRYYNPAEVDFRAADFRFYGYCDPLWAAPPPATIPPSSRWRWIGTRPFLRLGRGHPAPPPGQDHCRYLEKERLLRRETGRGYAPFFRRGNQPVPVVLKGAACQGNPPVRACICPFRGVPLSTEDKTMRVETLQPDVKNGYILFRRDQTLLLQQLSQFPLGAHDDGPDALEGARTLARKQSRTANLSGLHL